MSTVKERVQKYELNARKALGQNFILDTNLLTKIAKMALVGKMPDTVIEVGPGPGGLTQALLEQNIPLLVAIEKDERCMDVLAEVKALYPTQLRLLNKDALTVHEEKLGHGTKIIVANLPYNIATVLLLKWLPKMKQFQSMTLMFQKEVADRLVAHPGTKAYGRLSVLTQGICDVEELMVLPPAVFTPQPKVMSSLVRLTPKQNPMPVDFADMERVLAVAFNQRRKMLRSALKPLGDVEKLCLSADINSQLRAENLTVDDFVRLVQAVKSA